MDKPVGQMDKPILLTLELRKIRRMLIATGHPLDTAAMQRFDQLIDTLDKTPEKLIRRET